MKKRGVLNAELSKAIAAMGHTDIMMVVDAGYPIPRDAWRVDLAIAEDLPSTEQVIKLLADELFIEETYVAEDVPECNAPLNNLINETFTEAEHKLAKHEDLLGDFGKRAKVIVRTGAFNPWGNVALVSGVDAPKFFSKPGIKVPEAYKARVEIMSQKEN